MISKSFGLSFASDVGSYTPAATLSVVFSLCRITILAPCSRFVKWTPELQSGVFRLNLRCHGPEGLSRCDATSDTCSRLSWDAEGGIMSSGGSSPSGRAKGARGDLAAAEGESEIIGRRRSCLSSWRIAIIS